MSARSFRSVFMVASCAGAALGCYLVSLRVASERAALQEIESQILMAERDIRLLETEIGTRGRLAQLERWNVRVLSLSAPTADQFLDGGFALARLMKPDRKMDLEAPVVLASASIDAPGPRLPDSQQMTESGMAEDLIHVASLTRPLSEEARDEPMPPASKAPARSATGIELADASQAVDKKAGDNRRQAAARPVTKPARNARVDPLAPLPTASPKTGKENDTAR